MGFSHLLLLVVQGFRKNMVQFFHAKSTKFGSHPKTTKSSSCSFAPGAKGCQHTVTLLTASWIFWATLGRHVTKAWGSKTIDPGHSPANGCWTHVNKSSRRPYAKSQHEELKLSNSGYVSSPNSVLLEAANPTTTSLSFRTLRSLATRTDKSSPSRYPYYRAHTHFLDKLRYKYTSFRPFAQQHRFLWYRNL